MECNICHSERSEESHEDAVFMRFFAPLRMTWTVTLFIPDYCYSSFFILPQAVLSPPRGETSSMLVWSPLFMMV
jgi:hypothetical protein